MSKKLPPKTDAQSGIAIYQGADGRSQIQVRLENESVWVTQAGIAELYQTSIPNISIHLRNIFKEGELKEVSVVKKHLTTAADGKGRKVGREVTE